MNVNKTTGSLGTTNSNVNSVQAQGGGEDDLATKIYAAAADLEWPDFVAYLNKVFDVEHGRLLAELREKMPEIQHWEVLSYSEQQERGKGFNEAVAKAHAAIDAAIDATLDRLKGTSA